MNRNAPYYLAAKDALINWNGMDPVAAQSMIENSTRAEIEQATGAHGSVFDAAKRIATELGLTPQETVLFTQEMLGTTQSTAQLEEVKGRLAVLSAANPEVDKMLSSLVLDACDEIHKGWTGRNATPFFGKKDMKDQQYQYSTSEFIGWKEVKADFLFLSPVLDAVGISVSEDVLKATYAERVAERLKELQQFGQGIEGVGGPGIDTIYELIDIVDNVENGQRIMLSDEIAAAWEYNPDLVKQIAYEVSTKGIGADAELINSLIEQGVLNRDDPTGLERPI